MQAAHMKNALFLFAALATLAATGAQAECYADYKAKRDNPLRLHYGVARIDGPCDKGAAKSDLSPRLAADGWTLLNIVSVFDEGGLAERKDSAGKFYLRY